MNTNTAILVAIAAVGVYFLTRPSPARPLGYVPPFGYQNPGFPAQTPVQQQNPFADIIRAGGGVIDSIGRAINGGNSGAPADGGGSFWDGGW